MQNRQSNHFTKPGAFSKSENSQTKHIPNSNPKKRIYADPIDRDQPIIPSLFPLNQEAQ